MNVKGHRFWNESMICERRDFKLGVNKVNYFEICLDSEGFGPEMGLCPNMGEFEIVWIGTFGTRPAELGRFWRLKGLPENSFCGLARLGDIFWAELGRLDTEILKFFSTGFWTWVGHFGAIVGVDGVLKFSFFRKTKFKIIQNLDININFMILIRNLTFLELKFLYRGDCGAEEVLMALTLLFGVRFWTWPVSFAVREV